MRSKKPFVSDAICPLLTRTGMLTCSATEDSLRALNERKDMCVDQPGIREPGEMEQYACEVLAQ